MIEMLEEIVSSRLHGTAVIQRARCILLAFRKRKFWEISQIVNLSAKAVSRWFHRFADAIEALQHTETLDADRLRCWIR
jgi:transposase-like protein